MGKKSHYNSKYEGFSLIEILLSIALFSLTASLLIGMLVYIQDSNIAVSNLTTATHLAEEGIEIVYDIRNQNFQNLIDGTYGTGVASGLYELQGSSDIIGDFTRVITVDSTGLDTYTKRITSTVTWQNRVGGNRTADIEVLVTDWHRTIANVVPWSAPVLETTLDVFGNIDGRSVLVDGNYLYFLGSGGTEFIVYDISTPTAVTEIASIGLQSGPIKMIQQGNYIYIASTSNTQSFIIIDLTDPINPNLVTTEKIKGNEATQDVAVLGNTIYVLRDYPATSLPTKKVEAGDYSIASFDISNPSSPVHLGGTLINDGALSDLLIVGDYMYVSGGTDSSELYVLDLNTTSANPTVVATLDLTGGANALSLVSNRDYLFVGRDDGTIITVDISNPLTPTEAGTITIGDDINEMVIHNDLMFVASLSPTSEFAVLNISIPTAPTLIGSTDMLDVAWGVTYDPVTDRAYVAGGDNSGELTVYKAQ